MQHIMSNFFNKKTMPIWIGATGIALVIGIAAYAKTGYNNNPKSKYETVLHRIGMAINELHYSPKKINDAFSKQIFSAYFNQLDVNKDLLLATDITSLEKFSTKIDDEINGGKVKFFLEAGNIYSKRLQEAENIYKSILTQPFDFNVKEAINVDIEKLSFCTNEVERKERWRKKLKYQALMIYSDLLETREKNSGKDSFIVKTNAQLEKEARDKVLKNTNILFDKIKVKNTDDDRFNVFANLIANSMDPHTDYYPPVEKQNFNEAISGKFYGIGASLRDDENGNVKIETIVSGSPAWKSQQINPGDILLKVSQGNQPAIDMTGLSSSDAVKMIRGKEKGTEVKLTLKKTDGTIKIVTLIRDEIKLDDTYARSAVLEKNGKKIGYIFLPEFYVDLVKNEGGKGNCAYDVAQEVKKLKAEQVEGIVIDLRRNGGGSLQEVVKMVGLFIPQGPVVQVKYSQGGTNTQNDTDNSVLYDGPLTVMINGYSASASEIFAAAIQDYGRGVIVGSTSYGKGTVQRVVDLDDNDPSLGAVKMTIQKFYRINGGSTQIKGVTPDVVLPDIFDIGLEREQDTKNALAYDQINKSNYGFYTKLNIAAINLKSQARVNANNSFITLKKNIAFLKGMNDKSYSLNYDEYLKELKIIKTTSAQNNTLERSASMLKTSLTNADKTTEAKDRIDKLTIWSNNLQKDIYLDEATNVLLDCKN
jgi:carboxyl-terminal processing protease